MTAQNDTAGGVRARGDKVFFGHPAGLGWLSASEFWERFSYYGMLTLLALYMKHELFLPGHLANVWGFSTFRVVFTSFYGPMTPQALASNIYGFYAAFVYLTPLGGGFLADRYLGRTRAVIIGACLMALGHFLMAFEASFILALFCLLIGVGFFKGNIATQVGDLYGHEDPRRADAFQIYMLGIQIAVIGSPLVCGSLGEKVGWHWGFGVAGVGMLVGLATYLVGRPSFPPERPRAASKDTPARAPLSRTDRTNVIILIVLIPVMALSVVTNQQIGNAYMLWAETTYNLNVLGFQVPVTWMNSLDAIFGAITIAGAVLFWRWWGTKWAEPDELAKIIIGVIIAMIGPLCLAAAAQQFVMTGHRVSLGWALAFEAFNNLGFANMFPVGLALYSRAAPKGLGGMMIAVFYLHLFLGNFLIGYLGGFLDTMSGTMFWLMHAGLMAVSVVLLLAIRLWVGRALSPAYAEPAPAAEAA